MQVPFDGCKFFRRPDSDSDGCACRRCVHKRFVNLTSTGLSTLRGERVLVLVRSARATRALCVRSLDGAARQPAGSMVSHARVRVAVSVERHGACKHVLVLGWVVGIPATAAYRSHQYFFQSGILAVRYDYHRLSRISSVVGVLRVIRLRFRPMLLLRLWYIGTRYLGTSTLEPPPSLPACFLGGAP